MADEDISERLRALEEQIRQLNRRVYLLERDSSATSQTIIPEEPPSHPASVPPPPPLPEVSVADIRRPAPARPRISVEAAIGKNWASWVGAILLLLGVCFFLKYAWDHQWIHPTPMMRMLTGICCGVAVGILGEWTLRRAMRSLAGACFGACIAIVMASFIAAAVYFPPADRPITADGALEAVGVITISGVAIALRAANPAPAVIALIGAYLAPFILSNGTDQSLIFLIYITLVTAIGWGLDLLRWRWAAVRVTACAGAWTAYTFWQNDVGSHHLSLELIFASVFYAVFLVDFCVSAQRLSAQPDEKISASLQNILAILSAINTFLVFNAFYQSLYHQSSTELGIAALLLALSQAVAAGLLEKNPLKISNWLQAAALITLAIPLLLNHFAIVSAWALMALVLCILSRVLNLPWLYRWSISLWLLAVGRLLCVDEFQENLWLAWFHIGSLSICGGLLIAWGLSALAHAIANLRPASLDRSRFSGEIVPQVLAALGTVLFLSSKFIHWHPAEWTYTALLWTALLLALAPILQLDYAWDILLLLVAITLKWLIVDTLQPTYEHWDSSVHPQLFPFLNHSAIAGLLLIGLLIWCTMRFRRRLGSPVTLPAMSIWVGSVMFILISVEACRCVDYLVASNDAVIKQVVLSILWATIGLASVFVGFSRKIATLRYAALVLLGFTLLKILIIDMADIQAIWRILSFLGVGFLLLAVSYVYHRQLAQVGAE